HVTPELPVHGELPHLPQHAPRAREEDGIEEPEEDDEPGRETPQQEKGDDGAGPECPRPPAREWRPAEPPLHQVRHGAHATTSSRRADDMTVSTARRRCGRISRAGRQVKAARRRYTPRRWAISCFEAGWPTAAG